MIQGVDTSVISDATVKLEGAAANVAARLFRTNCREVRSGYVCRLELKGSQKEVTVSIGADEINNYDYVNAIFTRAFINLMRLATR